jgi:hypothetical protein
MAGFFDKLSQQGIRAVGGAAASDVRRCGSCTVLSQLAPLQFCASVRSTSFISYMVPICESFSRCKLSFIILGIARLKWNEPFLDSLPHLLGSSLVATHQAPDLHIFSA